MQKSFVISFISFHSWEIILSHAMPCLKIMLCWIVNTPHQRHYSGYVLIYVFCGHGGVAKDHEAPFSLNYVVWKTTKIWGVMLLLIVCYLQVLWN